MCQLKTSELLNILFPIVAQKLQQKAYNEILSTIFYYIILNLYNNNFSFSLSSHCALVNQTYCCH